MPSKMHSTTRPKNRSFTLKALSAAVVSALLFSNAYAAGLGQLTVLSSLGQPLRAEIELTSVSKDEAGALVAKLASPEAFRQANIDFNSALLSLRFAVEQRGARQFIRITSAQPLNEPFVDLLMELGGPNGRLVREYTFLLDPPDLRNAQTAQVAPLVVPEAGRARPAQANAPSAPVQQAAPVERPAPTRNPAPQAIKPTPTAETNAAAHDGQYQVKRGDSLAKIASQVKSGGVSLDQMLVALYRANPDSFVGNNMNRLRAGQILSVPSAETARSITNAEAQSVVLAQSKDFNNYRSRLAQQVATAAAQQSAESRQSAGGRITAKVEEPATPANESQDKLKLSKTNTAANVAASGTAAEDKIAAEKAIAEANARVKELEKNVGDLQKLLEVKNKLLAEQQKQADSPSAAAAPVAPAPANAAPADAATKGQQAVERAGNAAPVAAEAAKSPEPAAPVPPVAAVPKPVPPAPAPEPSFIDGVLGHPLTLPGAGILLAGLGALGIYSARRKKPKKTFEDSIITDSSLKANSLFGSTGGQSVDTSNSMFNSSFAPSASQLDSNEVDPVAEADVYIAYGRDTQAEEILKEALRTQPDRNAVRVKLLEIYSNRKDLRAFEVLATELYGLTKGEGDDWAQAALMGALIDPNNPLYAGGKTTKPEGMTPTVPPASAQALGAAGLATALPPTSIDTLSQTIGSLEVDTSYFSNTAPVAETPLSPSSNSDPVAETIREAPEPEPAAKTAPNEMDFDLSGMGFDNIEVPNTIARPVVSEPSVDMASIDFDFLLESPPVAGVPDADPAIAAVPSIYSDEPTPLVPEEASEPISTGSPADELPPLSMDLPNVEEIHASKPDNSPVEANADRLDFDLSDISLELDPAEAEPKPDLVFETHDTFDSDSDALSSTDAEMATKLDLAIAYQEIGDKEGARELLDEVIKAGSVEQSQKAKALLLELA